MTGHAVAGVRVNRAARDIGLLPRGASLLILAFLAAMAGDLGILGALIGITVTSSLDEAALGSTIGLFTGFCYYIFPPVFLVSRVTLALRAFRFLLWVLLCLHVPLLVWFLYGWAVHPGLFSAAVLSAPLAGMATLGLPAFACALFRRSWFALGSDPAGWEPMGGVDGQAARPARPSKLLVVLLPFWAAWRSGARAYAVIVLVLWAAGLWLLHVVAVLGITLIGCGIAVGWAVVGFADAKPPLPAKPFGPGERAAFLAQYLTPERLAPPPFLVSAGLLLLPLLLVLDMLTAGVLLGSASGFGVALIIVLFIVMLPLTAYLPLGTKRGIFTFRLVGGGMCLAELVLTALAVARGMNAVSIALLGGLVPVALIALSLVNAGRILDIPAALSRAPKSPR